MARSARRSVALCLASLAVLAGPLVVGHAATLEVASQALTTHSGSAQIAATTCTVGMAADSSVAKASPESGSGSSDVLAVKADTTGADPRRSLVRPDLSSCAIPSAAAVQSAQLALTMTSAPIASRLLAVHRATAAWTEAGVTWATQPGVVATATSSTPTGTTAGARLTWDVTADVAAIVAGTASNEGWLVRDTNEGDLDTGAQFAAREHATTPARPSLLIAYYP